MNHFSVARTAAMALFVGSLIVVGSRTDISGAPNQEPLMGGIHWARGEQHAPAARPRQSPNLLFHGGPVMNGSGTFVEPIFWGTSWSNDAQNKIGNLQAFYAGMSGSSYAGTNSEYTDASGAHVSTAISIGGAITDFSAATANGQQTGPVLAEVCAQITSPVANGYYPVYIDQPRGRARFCAWHSTGTCGGVQVQFAFFFNLDGDPGCDPQSTSTAYSQGVAALANVSGHELSETMTDRHLDAWYDANGSENADKCAWSFGTPLLSFNGGSEWKIQGNWSNAAFNAGSGYANSSGQNGCLDGGNYK